MVNVRKIVNTRVNALTNSKMDLEAIYNVMFMNKNTFLLKAIMDIK